jgi:uncharacterized protein YggU (UPF0235/DUF167 family)
VAARLSFAVVVRPRAGRTGILGRRADGALLVALRAAPEGGAANAELVQFLARSLAVPASAVTIVRGVTARAKQVRVEGGTAAMLSRLAPLPAGAPPVAPEPPAAPPRSRKKP